MIHVSEISAEKRINHRAGRAQSRADRKSPSARRDGAKRNVRLSIKQMALPALDEYMPSIKKVTRLPPRDAVSGWVARVELGEGVFATCRMVEEAPAKEEKIAAANQPIFLR